MNTNQNQCDQLSLSRMLDDELADDEQSQLIEHLDRCETCRQALQTRAADDSMWVEAATFLTPAPDDDELTEVDFTRASDEVGVASDETIAANLAALDFLAPSDDDTMLGRVGCYEVSGIVGRGGMGIVLKAFEPALKRNVAIKVLAPHLATSGAARQRFSREAQAAAAVVHDHVVPIHAVDEAQGLPYMVMRYVAGASLQRRIDRDGPLRLAEILRIAMQTAAGLAAAHAQGLIHRDIKPANILLERNVERAVITDFGLARAADDASLTRSGVIIGTPLYMAPEQARGEPVDCRTDLFSLGSVIHAMATGHSPFRAETTMGILHRICEHAPRPMRRSNPDVPGWLDDIVAKLHAKRPDDRFQSAEEVAALLGAHLAHLQQPTVVPRPPRVALPPSLVKREASNARRNWAMLAVSLLIAAFLGLLSAGSGLFSGSVPGDNPTKASEEGSADSNISRPLTHVPTAREIQGEIADINGVLDDPALRPRPPSVDVDHSWRHEMEQLNRRLDSLEQSVAGD